MSNTVNSVPRDTSLPWDTLQDRMILLVDSDAPYEDIHTLLIKSYVKLCKFPVPITGSSTVPDIVKHFGITSYPSLLVKDLKSIYSGFEAVRDFVLLKGDPLPPSVPAGKTCPVLFIDRDGEEVNKANAARNVAREKHIIMSTVYLHTSPELVDKYGITVFPTLMLLTGEKIEGGRAVIDYLYANAKKMSR